MRASGWGVLFLLWSSAGVAAQQDPADAAWRAGERERAEQLYGARVAADSSDTLALQRLATLLAWRGEYAGSLALYDRLLQLEPRNTEARTGRARVLAWRGDLAAAAAELESIRAAHPDDVAVLIALAQVRRWQQRDADALLLLEHAERQAPGDASVREQLLHVRAVLATRTTGALVSEHDSDDNDVLTLSAAAAAPLAARTSLRGTGYARRAEDPAGERRAAGLSAGVSLRTRGGWDLGGGAGVALHDGGTDPYLLANVAISTPSDAPAAVTVTVAQAAFDATAALIRNEVVTREVAAELRTRLARVDAVASASVVEYDSRPATDTNRRLDAQLALTHDVAGAWTVGVRGRMFGFREDLQHGYFDPARFALAELTARYQRETRRWLGALEVAPGWQRIRQHGAAAERSVSARASTRLLYLVAPGRNLGVTAAWAQSGEQQLSTTGDAEYRYVAFGITGSWTF